MTKPLLNLIKVIFVLLLFTPGVLGQDENQESTTEEEYTDEAYTDEYSEDEYTEDEYS